ncbi:MAG TPA: glycosyltransferase family 4 protein [Candidatus Woesebacteria bacterium]|nr:glycosyltransferase family 4 protein [Candidatus Woesebacteria bacterium]HPJ17068.1 glycosyltransferase family 4 protein [Candidatus Woesebacteria bacterium]
MKIAIYHNLDNGGALNQIENISLNLSKNNCIDLYCHKIPKNISFYNNVYSFPENNKKNIIIDLFFSIFTLNKIAKKISKTILNNQYDLVIIGACKNIQTPYLFHYLNNAVYIFSEPKREFYEKTAFLNNFKKRLAKFFRLPLKLIDYVNCKKANLIITNSQYSNYLLKKIYNKKGFVLYPGLKYIHKTKIIKNPKKEILSIGQLSYLKGHQISLNQIKNIKGIKLLIIGRITDESNYIFNQSKLLPNTKIIQEENNKNKEEIIKKHSFYLANNIKEPFGLTTLEALNKGLFVFGINTGGTSELIRNGLNGILFQNDKIANYHIKQYLNKKIVNLHQLDRIDWSNYTKNLLMIIANNGQLK